jgi:outer membrane protein assembly factor BamE
VVDPFRADRWDYVFVYMKQGVVTEQRRIMVVFKDEKLDRIEGDVVPAGAGKAAADKPAPPAARDPSAQNAER